MAKLRKIQFYRNGQVNPIDEGGLIGQQNYNVTDLKSAYVYAEALFKQPGNYNDMLDGEILLYRFSYNSTVHTLVGVVHVDGEVRSLEVLANYDMLDGEISAAIAELDGTATIATVTNDGVVTLKADIKQENGIVSQGTGSDITLAKVATTGAAADVKLSEGVSVIEAIDVESALVEIATEIDAMDMVATDVVALNETATALQAKKISETDGVIALGDVANVVEFNQAISSTNKVATMADVTTAQNNATVVGKKAIKVENAPQGQNGKVVSLNIKTNDKVLTQDADGLLANISLTYDSTNKKIKLLGKEVTPEGGTAAPVEISTIDATDFIKDGMLENAKIVTLTEGQVTGLAAGEYIELTFNTEAGKNPIYISVKDLIDAYSADETYLHLNGFKFEHKTQSGLPEAAQGIVETVTGTGVYEETKTFKVPQLTVDAAGHVTAVNEKEVSIKLPAKQVASDVAITAITGITATDVQGALAELQGDIDAINAVNWNGDGDGTGAGEIIVDDTAHTISHKKHAIEESESTNTDAVKSVVIPQLTVNDYGHVTAIDNKTFEIDFNVTTVSGTAGQIVVTPTPAEGTEDINYTVGLAKVVTGEATNVAPTESTDDYALKSVETTGPQQHTRVENITVDAYGRVTAYTLTTVEENWDCGTWE